MLFIRNRRTSTRKRSRFAASASFLVLLSLVLTVISPIYVHNVAQADVNSQVKITNLKLLKQGSDGPVDGPLYVGDNAKFTFDWDASEANPKPGDSFSIELPKVFENATTDPVVIPFEGKDVLRCVRENSSGGGGKITCTFLGTILGMVNIKGSGEATIKVVGKTAEKNVGFKVSSETDSVIVPLPGNSPIIGPGGGTFSPRDFAKRGMTLSATSEEISWLFRFGPSSANNPYPGGEIPETMVLSDIKLDGHNFDRRLKKWQLLAVGNDQPHMVDPNNSEININGTSQWIKIADATGSFHHQYTGIDPYTGYTITPEFDVDGDPNKARITLKGPWKANQNYALVYFTYPTNGPTYDNPAQQDGTLAVKGFHYKNTISVEGTGKEYEASSAYEDTLVITPKMEPNFGAFRIKKSIAGSNAALIPQGTNFKVKASWKLPEGETPEGNYPGWVFPPNPFELTVQAGGNVTTDAAQTLPHGTVVTFEEVLPDVPGIGWGTPVFTPNQITIARQKVVEVSLTNTANPFGKFSIKKTVEANGAAAPADFKFKYDCGAGEQVLVVPGNGAAVESPAIASGVKCSISEDTDAAQVEGYSLNAQLSATEVTIAKGQTVEVTASNTYTRDMGKFSIKKTATEEGNGKEFTFNYTCTLNDQDLPDGTGQITATAGGDAVTVEKEFPTGTKCTITEIAEKANITGSTLTVPEPQEITIDQKGQTVEVHFHNKYIRDTGEITITKKVTGAASNKVADQSFQFTYICTGEDAAQTITRGAFSLKNGESKKIVGIPTGHCVVTEVDPANIDKVIRTTSINVDGVTTEGTLTKFQLVKDSSIKIIVTNTYTPVPKKPELPKTGSDALIVLPIAMMAMLLGGGLLLASKRRS